MKFHFSRINLLILLFLASCSSLNIDTRIKNAEIIANKNNFTKKLIKGGDFVLTTYSRVIDKNLPYAFYIEKDGYSFSQIGASDNPTPIEQMLLKLASLDNARNIVYIARPCQYTDFSLDQKCLYSSYWTNKRFAKEVIISINEVIKNFTNKPFSIIGHSGGGGIAILIASISNNVKDIITIAGNLDTVSFNDIHHTPQMTSSLNPIDYAKDVSNIPQLHLAGGRDKIVPPEISELFRAKSNSSCVHTMIIPNAAHNKGWDKVWKNILIKELNCNR